MPLLDYTTSVSVHQSSAEIRKLLVKAGATSILEDYDADGDVTGLSFIIATPLGRRSYALPIRAAEVEKVLASQRARNSRVNAAPAQAQRVAWRILRHWLAAQLAIVETQMVALDQVMLPYMHTGPDRAETVYDMVLGGAVGELEPGEG